MVWQDGPAGVEEQGTHGRVPPGTWETSSSPTAELRRYRQAKATKRGEMGGEESERAIVAVKRGNSSKRTPWSEGRAGTWNRERERWQGRRAQYPSQHDSNG